MRFSSRPKLGEFRPGHVFMMPGGATWLNHDKPRPFVLATPSSPARLGTFVYGSTKPTESLAAAAFARVEPVLAGVNTNGLRTSTYFYPGLMLPIEYIDLPPHAGHLGSGLAHLREALVQAIGLGSGTCADFTSSRGSKRGRVVRFHPDLAEDVQTEFGVVLTEHIYSREQRYQLVVPIIRGDDRESEASVLRVHGKDWLAIFDQPTTSALLAPTVLQSAWHVDDIIEETRFVIDSTSLQSLEERLRLLFGIPVTNAH